MKNKYFHLMDFTVPILGGDLCASCICFVEFDFGGLFSVAFFIFAGSGLPNADFCLNVEREKEIPERERGE